MPGGVPVNMKSFPLHEDLNCDNAVKCFFDLNQKELDLYRDLVRNGPSTASELGERICRDRSTAYRSVSGLVENGLVEKKRMVQDGGGIFHVYQAVEPVRVQEMLHSRIDSWYRVMKKTADRAGDDLMEAIPDASD
jgi:predicted transcriptional regulator